jgi:hypothetical protein
VIGKVGLNGACPSGPRSPFFNFNRGIVERAYESSIYVEKGFLFDHASHARRHKVTQSESGSNVNSVPQEEHQKKQRMRFGRWATSISSPLQSCSGTMSLVKHGKPHKNARAILPNPR